MDAPIIEGFKCGGLWDPIPPAPPPPPRWLEWRRDPPRANAITRKDRILSRVWIFKLEFALPQSVSFLRIQVAVTVSFFHSSCSQWAAETIIIFQDQRCLFQTESIPFNHLRHFFHFNFKLSHFLRFKFFLICLIILLPANPPRYWHSKCGSVQDRALLPLSQKTYFSHNQENHFESRRIRSSLISKQAQTSLE